MAALNKYAADAVRSLDGVHACTDVTGFSLLGHSYEMCGDSGLTVIIDSSRVPLLPGADSYASMGLVPAVAYQNMNHLKDKVALPKDLPSHVHDLLFDPQTSGGLLYSVASQEAGRIMEALQKACQTPAVIGHVEGPSYHPVMVICQKFHKKEADLSSQLYKPGADSLPPSTLLYLPHLIHF